MVQKIQKIKSILLREMMVLIFAQFLALREIARKFVPAKISTIKVINNIKQKHKLSKNKHLSNDLAGTC